MFEGRKVSLVMPAYNEEKSVGKVVADNKALKIFDEIIVVDNNSTDGTSGRARRAGAKVVREERQGYGFSIRRGLAEAKGDIIVITEADDTFEARDAFKLLNYMRDADLVLGSRTNYELVKPGAKMGWFLKWGNFCIAKLIQLLWVGKVRLTDVGCTFRAISRPGLRRIIKNLEVGGSSFSPEMIVECLKSGMKVVEIPVWYKARIGESKITSTSWKSLVLGIEMILLILKERFAS